MYIPHLVTYLAHRQYFRNLKISGIKYPLKKINEVANYVESRWALGSPVLSALPVDSVVLVSLNPSTIQGCTIHVLYMYVCTIHVLPYGLGGNLSLGAVI